MTQQRDPGSLLVLAFDSRLKAQEAFLAFQRLQTEETIVLHDAVFFTKDDAGRTHVQETTDVSVGAGAASSVAGPLGTLVGGAVSAGLGALSAKLIDIGIPDATVKEIEDALTPNSAALALLVSHVKEDALAVELKRFSGATLTRSTLSDETVERLRSALTR